MNVRPIVPYAQRAPLRPNRRTRKLALSAVKNHSQLNRDAEREVAPANRNISWTILCSIMPLLSSVSSPEP